MRIAEVIGRLTLSKVHPALPNARFIIALPLPREAILEGSSRRGEEVVAYDQLGAGPGAIIGLSEGREAAAPFGKTKTPVDAYCACLLDQINVEPLRTRS
jgi:ethanolamine utilization protein EutN